MAFVYWIRLPEHTDLLTEGYIGFTSKTPEFRFKKHVDTALYGKRRLTRLMNAIRKYGRENLIVETLCVGDVDYLLDLEKRLRPGFDIGWNHGIGGDMPTIGRVATTEERAHFSRIYKGKGHSEEWRKMMSEKFKGRKFRLGGRMPQSARDRISVWAKARRHTPETKQKMRMSQLGKRRSQETRQRIGDAQRGRKQSPETIEKRAATLRGRVYPIVSCPHCGTEGGRSAMLRHHFNNCKNLKKLA